LAIGAAVGGWSKAEGKVQRVGRKIGMVAVKGLGVQGWGMGGGGGWGGGRGVG